jgi:hypothetical protein
MSLLYSHAGNPHLSLAELAQVPTPPAMGPRHNPYPFHTYVEDVEESLDRVGYEVLERDLEVTHDQQRFFGALAIAPRGERVGEIVENTDEDMPIAEWRKNDAGYELLIGLRGAHDQSIQREMVLGDNIFVCSNLAFSGSIGHIATKQTTFIHRRLPGLISSAVAKIPELAEQRANMFDAFKNYEFKNPRAADAAMVEIFRQGGLSAAQLGKAIHELDKPTYEEHLEWGRSAWLVRNCVTQALKPGGANVNHNLIADRTTIADRFLSNLVGIAA